MKKFCVISYHVVNLKNTSLWKITTKESHSQVIKKNILFFYVNKKLFVQKTGFKQFSSIRRCHSSLLMLW